MDAFVRGSGLARALRRGGVDGQTEDQQQTHARGDERYVRRDAKGRIKESADVGRASVSDRKRRAKTRLKPGHGDTGDR